MSGLPAASPGLRHAVAAARREGPVALLRRGFSSRVLRPLLRNYVHPWRTARALREMRRRNERARRQGVPAGGSPGCVLVVGCVDTEGPNGYAQGATWPSVEAEVDRVNGPEFRSASADPEGSALVLSWFVVDWVGAVGATRGLDIGPHRILDRYRQRIADLRAAGHPDELHWHYHHVQPEGIDRWNRNWSAFPGYEEILSRRLLERGVWSSTYRAGNTWEDNESSAWLERFLPFDFSNRAPYRDLHYDWSRAPSDWSTYHPAPHDFQQPGAQTRLVGRSLGIEEGAFSADDVEQAFLAAARGSDACVSYYLHDYRPMAEQITTALTVVREVGARFPSVPWRHRGAAAALAHLSKRADPGALDLTGAARLRRDPDGSSRIEVDLETSHPIHGEPWLAVQRAGRCAREDMVPAPPLRWRATLDASGLEAAAVGACDPVGQTAVAALSLPTTAPR